MTAFIGSPRLRVTPMTILSLELVCSVSVCVHPKVLVAFPTSLRYKIDVSDQSIMYSSSVQ